MDRPNPLDETQAQADRLDEQMIELRGQPHPMIVVTSRCSESGPDWLNVNLSFTVAGIVTTLPNMTTRELSALGLFLGLYAARIAGNSN